MKVKFTHSMLSVSIFTILNLSSSYVSAAVSVSGSTSNVVVPNNNAPVNLQRTKPTTPTLRPIALSWTPNVITYTSTAPDMVRVYDTDGKGITVQNMGAGQNYVSLKSSLVKSDSFATVNDILNRTNTIAAENRTGVQTAIIGVLNNIKDIDKLGAKVTAQDNDINNLVTSANNDEWDISQNTASIQKQGLDVSANRTDIKMLSNNVVNDEQTIHTNSSQISANHQNVELNHSAILNNERNIQNESHAREVGDARTLQAADNYTDSKLDRVESKLNRKINENSKKIKQVGAMATAMASLHYSGNHSGYAVSLGNYMGNTAISGGTQFALGEHEAITTQISWDGNGLGSGIGLHGDF